MIHWLDFANYSVEKHLLKYDELSATKSASKPLCELAANVVCGAFEKQEIGGTVTAAFKSPPPI